MPQTTQHVYRILVLAQDYFPSGLTFQLTFCRGGGSGWEDVYAFKEAICKLIPLGIFVM